MRTLTSTAYDIFNFPKSIILVVALLYSGCGKSQTTANIDGYNLKKPSETIILPDSLKEVSGITAISGSQFACIQDENGIVFIYDTRLRKIVHQYVFNINGDYEGIARAGKSLYILRSDGTLYEVADYHLASSDVNTYVTGIMTGNNEGLCLDVRNNRLLISSKSNAGKGSGLKDLRIIYGFDLKTKELSPKPAYQLYTETITAFAKEHRVNIPIIENKKGKRKAAFKLRMSDIDIHPITHEIYLISAIDHMLCVLKADGTISGIELLDPEVFNKPEGITFLSNGDMVITNEGEDKKPTLLKFTYVKY